MQSPRSLPGASLPAVRSLMLAPGQRSYLWLEAGTSLISNGTSMVVTPAPQWLAGQMLQQPQRIDEGQSLWLERGGWIQVDAARGGELLCLTPACDQWLTRLLRSARHWLGCAGAFGQKACPPSAKQGKKFL